MYLDAPDLIVECDSEPIFSVEVSTEAGTGHNAFQRFARLAAAVENNVPAFYIYPEAAIITRQNSPAKWDKINPLIFTALEAVMGIYEIPALLHYFPSEYLTHSDASLAPNLGKKGLLYQAGYKYAGSPLASDAQMQSMFQEMDLIVELVERHNSKVGISKLLKHPLIRSQRDWMNAEKVRKGAKMTMSPLSAVTIIDTALLLAHLERYENAAYSIGNLLRSRPKTAIYQVDAAFRGDPYPGALAAIDYLICRTDKTFEDRQYNLVMAWGKLTLDASNQTFEVVSTKCSVVDFFNDVRSSEAKNLLTKCYSQLKPHEIPRYYMQARYGSMFSKVKHIRVYSYFADAILFQDGALWRDA